MTKEDYEKKFLKKYGCKTLYEFIDTYLDFDLAIELLTDYFLKCSYVINLEKNILERNKNEYSNRIIFSSNNNKIIR